MVEKSRKEQKVPKIILCRTLLGKRTLEFSIECLSSLLNNCVQPVRLEIFDDGSLQLLDIERLHSRLPNSFVVTKKERDLIIGRKLQGYTKCINFRAVNVMAFKILDTMLYNDEEFFYVDSDIFFLQKFLMPPFSGRPLFMRDDINGYTFNPLFFRKLKEPILPFANAGFMHFPAKLYNLGVVEQLLEKCFRPDTLTHWWAEQTLWAMIGSGIPSCSYFERSQVIMASNHLSLDKNTVCVHLISPARYQFPFLKKYSQTFKGDTAPIQISTREIHRTLHPIMYLILWSLHKSNAPIRKLRSEWRKLNNLNKKTDASNPFQHTG